MFRVLIHLVYGNWIKKASLRQKILQVALNDCSIGRMRQDEEEEAIVMEI
jgi:hypothetical protein